MTNGAVKKQELQNSDFHSLFLLRKIGNGNLPSGGSELNSHIVYNPAAILIKPVFQSGDGI